MSANTAIENFEVAKYVFVKNLLGRVECEQLSAHLKNLAASSKTIKDDQCPKSEAVYGDAQFDQLLEHLLPKVESITGKKLYPTYSYARLYQPGEELKIHNDRPACEISLTLTLGFAGSKWPIYMADDKNKTNAAEILMDVGDAVVYMGGEKYHWRDTFSGDWQTQVFLHYVDANGKNADQKFDRRERLSHHVDNAQADYWHIENAIPPDAAKRLIEQIEKIEATDGTIGGDEQIVEKSIRNVKKIPLPTFAGIGASMAGAGIFANQQTWNFSVSYADQCDYLIYNVGGHYKPHLDIFMNSKQKFTRKLTVLAFLNDDFEGGRLFLQTGNEVYYPPQTAGSMLVFPSFILHGVEPVTKGVRRSVVTWLVGPWWT